MQSTFRPILFFLVLITFIFGNLVWAANEATVTATVTPQSISLTVSDGTVAYGTASLSGSANTTSSGTNDSQTVTNNGNVTEDFDIKGSDSTAWTLAGTAGANAYKHSFCTTDCDGTPSWTALTTSYQELGTSIATSGTKVFDLKIDLPTSTSAYDQQSVDVWVLATAT